MYVKFFLDFCIINQMPIQTAKSGRKNSILKKKKKHQTFQDNIDYNKI